MYQSSFIGKNDVKAAINDRTVAWHYSIGRYQIGLEATRPP